MRTTSSLELVTAPTVVALGNFDGVHRGHLEVIQPILGKLLASKDLCPTVATFSPHPRSFFTGQSQLLLTPLSEKQDYLATLGVEQLILIPFDRDLASLSPEAFVKAILVEKLQARAVSVGQDFRFGKDRSGTAADLQTIARQFDIDVYIAPLCTQQSERISSSAIRTALQEGSLSAANQLLGRPYRLVGTVVAGQQIGRTIDFPTANLEIPSDKFLPKLGVYCGWVYASGLATELQPLPGVLNIGRRPTVEGDRVVVEVHIPNWQGDLYGQTLTILLEAFLRPEQKFASLGELKQQIAADRDEALAYLAAHRSTVTPLNA